MFAAPGIGAMIDIPAGKAAEVLNARQAAAHHGFGQGPGLLVDEQRRTEGQRAAG